MPERDYSDRRSRECDALAEEARRLAEDPVDSAEMRAVREDMDALSPGWPYDEDETPSAG